jgi:hypothetical protein
VGPCVGASEVYSLDLSPPRETIRSPLSLRTALSNTGKPSNSIPWHLIRNFARVLPPTPQQLPFMPVGIRVFRLAISSISKRCDFRFESTVHRNSFPESIGARFSDCPQQRSLSYQSPTRASDEPFPAQRQWRVAETDVAFRCAFGASFLEGYEMDNPLFHHKSEIRPFYGRRLRLYPADTPSWNEPVATRNTRYLRAQKPSPIPRSTFNILKGFGETGRWLCSPRIC